MRTRWTTEEMENILIQLNNSSYPFKNYSFPREDTGLVKLGSGGYADIYEMELNDNPDERFAVKVLGFADKHVDTEEFKESVRIQRELSLLENDIVKIVDYAEMRVFLDKSYNVVKAEKVSWLDDKEYEGDYLILQFILMEKLVPVITIDKSGKPKLYPDELARFEENEIMKLAHNIGTALARGHKGNLLHRDVKLENVFYDPKKKIYKLGDFGIAKITKDGMASTIAFTKGYGAPEVVGAKDNRYDNTADIYSYGMMLYLLLNELRFPNSENYNVNQKLQYSKGYEFPQPKHNDYELSKLVERMCKFNPDMRYQSMETVMNDIEGIMVGDDTRYKKENIKSTYIAGYLFFVFGVILLKLTHMPNLVMDIGLWGYILLIVGIALFGGTIVGLACIGVVIVDLVTRLMNYYPNIYSNMEQYKWVTILLLSLSFILFMQHSVLTRREIKLKSWYYKLFAYWNFPVMMYGILLIMGLIMECVDISGMLENEIFKARYEIAVEYDFLKIGLFGTLISAGLLIREKFVKRFLNGE